MFKDYGLWTPRISSGIIYILAGLIILLYPAMTAFLFANVVSALVLVYGISGIIRWVRGRREGKSQRRDLVSGMIIALAGLIMIFNTPWVMAFLPIVTGGILIADAIVKIPSAMEMRREFKAPLLPMILAIAVPALLGLILIIFPITGIAAMVACFGAFMTAVGIMDIISILMLKRMIRKEAVL